MLDTYKRRLEMTGARCCVCGNTKAQDPSVTFHRIPKEPSRKALWLETFNISEEDSTRVCCRHFPDGDSHKLPSTTLGKRLASPMKKNDRMKRAKLREKARELSRSSTPCMGHSSRSETPAVSDQTPLP